MTSKEALEEIKDYGLVTYDEEGNEEDCITFGELEPNLIEAIEKDLEILEIIRNKSVDIRYIRLCMDVNDGLHKMYNYSAVNSNDELTEEEYNKITGWLQDE